MVVVIMNSSYWSSENLVLDNTFVKRTSHTKRPSWEGDSDKWTSSPEPQQVSSLAFLPILGMIIFVVCSFLKVYKWSRDSARWKARGDIEFGDEAEVNYGIIKVGDKDFCQIDIRSDGTSVYDTVNSFRLLGYGYNSQLSENYAYNDTVTSFKSLLMQKADGGQYDSVKSYKAFLQKATQNKDLAVEVKLLGNYPAHSRSTEQCVHLKDACSERLEAVSSKIIRTLSMKDNSGKDVQPGKKKPRCRRASGDVQTVTRKRSLSNPGSRRVTSPACSLPSMRNTFSFSGDPEDSRRQSFRFDRKRNGSKTQRHLQSNYGKKVSTIHGDTVQEVSCGKSSGSFPKRKRHFSEDGVRSLKKTSGSMNNKCNHCVNNKTCLNGSLELTVETTNMAKTKKSINAKMEGSSSDNPNSSHSSDTDVPSDALASGSDNDTRKNIPLSIISDGKTLDNNLFTRVHPTYHLPFSSETLLNPPTRALSDTRILLAKARENFFQNKLNNAFSLMSPPLMSQDLIDSGSPAKFRSNTILSAAKIVPVDVVSVSGHHSHSISLDKSQNVTLAMQTSPKATKYAMGSQNAEFSHTFS